MKTAKFTTILITLVMLGSFSVAQHIQSTSSGLGNIPKPSGGTKYNGSNAPLKLGAMDSFQCEDMAKFRQMLEEQNADLEAKMADLAAQQATIKARSKQLDADADKWLNSLYKTYNIKPTDGLKLDWWRGMFVKVYKEAVSDN